ncbi:FumA C-terminus/TtdB family hydratase beta subunit [Methanobacterium petrolearium]|uniref:FumA C-terminus/TtdB family hydratase beta subunit n=1 Tax=Methanobacterium petrolearium TaxID=710190 RepID=UPI001AE129E3|nr:FumA C-terminus/TtdB family hydratase beta subunit [Methanobacterium petrolearium]MBP1945577.1 fumarate hydratase subunit beta [Methanobacterium petrolearium]BDZ71795.1 fumarate hydratase [Methanobacterium petrolearium]
MIFNLKTPLNREETRKLRIKDSVYISGTIYTARDSAHQRMIQEGSPVILDGAVIFHAGPIIRRHDDDYEMVAVGPTTSTRMNPYQAEILDKGALAVIGKGGMDDGTSEALKRNGAVFLAAVGGCAALYVSSVNKVKGVHWLDLGVPEAIWELEVENFGPLIVAMDSTGANLYEETRKK